MWVLRMQNQVEAKSTAVFIRVRNCSRCQSTLSRKPDGLNTLVTEDASDNLPQSTKAEGNSAGFADGAFEPEAYRHWLL
jgi:hypothetical protein